MNKKTIALIFSFLGIVSLFLPYNQNIVIACGKNFSSKEYYHNSFINFITEFFNRTLNLSDIIEVFLILIIYFSLIFSSILFLFNKIRISIFLIVITLILMTISFVSSRNDLLFGYYLMAFHQILFLFYIVKSKNKFKLA